MSDYYVVDGEHLTDIADALREKTGENGNLEFPDGFTGAIGKLGLRVGTVSKSGSGSNIMEFTDILREPAAFALIARSQAVSQQSGAKNYTIPFASWDGTTHRSAYLYSSKVQSGNNYYGTAGVVSINASAVTHAWNSGTLTITAGSGTYKFDSSKTYDLIYIN